MNAEAAARLATVLGSQERASSAFHIGTIRAAGRGILRVYCKGLLLEREDLWLDPRLNFHWTLDHGEPDFLRAGERVLLLSLDSEDFYLIGKTVHA